MNAELKQKWIAALRSGGWKQARGHLRRLNVPEYCCLGVLCEVSGEGLVLSSISREWNATWQFHRAPNTLAPGSYGMTGVEIDQLTSLNDGGNDFPAIADWIDANIKEDA